MVRFNHPLRPAAAEHGVRRQMAVSATLVICSAHGERPVRFVCIHIARATDSGEKVGFHLSGQDGDLPPIAWCEACEEWLRQPGAAWNEAFKLQAQFVPFCADCFQYSVTLS